MKTVVVGVFDLVEDAERVLVHLASSPLDLETIQVVHAHTDTQRQLTEVAGLPPRRSVRNGLVIGVVAGAGLGLVAALPSVAGELPLLSDLGPLLSMAAGAIIGALAGAAAGALAENVRLPPDHAAAILAALEGGATVIMVHTENLPTARAIGELFRAGGSRAFEAGHPLASTDGAAGLAAIGGAMLVPDDAQTAGPTPANEPAVVPEAHLPYAPPWRRSDGGDEVNDVEAGNGWDETGIAASPDPASDILTSGDLTPSDLTSGDLTNNDFTSGDRTTSNLTNNDFISADLVSLGLSARVLRSLDQAGVGSVSELSALANQGDAALLAVRGIGPLAVEEIRDCLARTGQAAVQAPGLRSET